MADDVLWVLDADAEPTVAALEQIDQAASAMGDTMAQAVASMEEEIATLTESLTELSALADETSGAMSGMSDAMALMGSTIEEDNAMISSLNETIANLEGQIAALTMEEGGAAESTSGLAAAFAGLGETASGVGEALNAAQGSFMIIGMAASLVGGKLIGMGLDGQKGEALLSGFAGASQQDIAALQQEALKLGLTMDKASQGFYEVESAGYSGSQAIMVFDAAMKLAEGGQANAMDATAGLTAIMHDYNASADQATHYTDLMALAIKRGKQVAQDFTANIGPLAAAGSNVGLSFEQVAAAEATMTQISPHVALDAQQLRQMFQFLSPTMGGVAKAAHGLHLHFDEAHYSSLDLIGKLRYLAEIAGGTNTAAFIKLTGGVRGSVAAIDLLKDGGKTFQDNLNAMGHAAGTTASAFDTWENTIPAHLDKVGAALSVFATRFMDAIGPKIIPVIDTVTSAIGQFANFFVSHLDQMMPIIYGLAAAIGVGLVAALVAFLAPAWPVIAALAAVGVAVAGVTMLIQQHAGVIGNAFDQMNHQAELATLQMKMKTTEHTLDMAQRNVASIQYQEQVIEQKIEHTRDAHTRAMLEMKLKALQASEQQANGVVKNIEKERHGIEAQMQQLDTSAHLHALQMKDQSITTSLQQAQGVINNIQAQERAVENAIVHTRDAHTRHMLMMRLEALEHSEAQQQGVVKNIEKQKQGVESQMSQLRKQMEADSGNILIRMLDAFNHVKDAVINGLGAAFKFVLPILQQIGSYIAAQFVPVWQQLVQMWQGQLMPLGKQLWGAIQPLIPVLEFLGAIIAGVVVLALGLLVGILAAVLKGLAGLLSGVITIIGGIVRLFTGLMQVFGGLVGFFVDLFTGNFSHLGADLGMIWQGIINIFQGGWQIIVGLFQAAWGLISGIVTGFVDGILGFFTHLWDALVGHSIIPDMINGIFEWFDRLVSQGLTFITNLVVGILSWMVKMEAMVLATITEMVDMFLQWLDKLTGGAVTKAQAVVSGITGALGNLGKLALKWGSDLMNGLISGIQNGIAGVGHAAQNVASTISSWLHFSKPDIGPLASFDEWMPHFGDQLSKGLSDQSSKMKEAASSVAGELSVNLAPQMNAAPVSAPAGGFSGLSGSTASTVLLQILAVLQQQQRGGGGSAPTNITMNNTNTFSGISNIQQLYNLFNQMSGQAFEAGGRGAY